MEELIRKIELILIETGQHDLKFRLGEIIKYSPKEVGEILRKHKDELRQKWQWIPCTKNGLPLSEMAYRDGQKWYGYKCSRCNFIYKGNALTESPYCKKCGADMRGTEHE